MGHHFKTVAHICNVLNILLTLCLLIVGGYLITKMGSAAYQDLWFMQSNQIIAGGSSYGFKAIQGITALSCLLMIFHLIGVWIIHVQKKHHLKIAGIWIALIVLFTVGLTICYIVFRYSQNAKVHYNWCNADAKMFGFGSIPRFEQAYLAFWTASLACTIMEWIIGFATIGAMVQHKRHNKDDVPS